MQPVRRLMRVRSVARHHRCASSVSVTTSSDHVAHLMLDRPEKMNAFSMDMFDDLLTALHELQRADDVRAIVLSGNGKCFSAGIDLSVLASGSNRQALLQKLFARAPHTPGNFVQSPALTLRNMPVPVIGAAHGVCYGAGLQIFLGCDIRVGSGDARFSLMELKHGLIPDMGITTLAAGMRPDHLKSLMFTARVFDATTAERYGVLTEVANEPVAAALELARHIAAQSPFAVRRAKQLVNEGVARGGDAGLALEEQLQLECLQSTEFRAKMAAALGKGQK